MKIFKEKKTKLLNSSNRNKSNKRNIKSFSPINKSSSKNKIINVLKKKINIYLLHHQLLTKYHLIIIKKQIQI